MPTLPSSAPILLIVFGSIDYARATAEGSEKGLRKANKKQTNNNEFYLNYH